MGRSPVSWSKPGEFHRGAWSQEEDEILTNYVKIHGEGRWRTVAQNAGLKRCAKSCRLRWLNYLKPGIKRGHITPDEEELIIRLHRLLGNRWSLIAGRLPGRTDNEIKNHWNTRLVKKLNSERPLRSNNNTNVAYELLHETPVEDGNCFVMANIDPRDVSDPNLSSVVPKQEEDWTNSKNLSVSESAEFSTTISGIENELGFLVDIKHDQDHVPGIWPVLETESIFPFLGHDSTSPGGDNDDHKLHDVEMMNVGAREPALLDMELKKLALFLDLEEE